MWEVLIKCGGFDVKYDTLNDLWVKMGVYALQIKVFWEILEVEYITCELEPKQYQANLSQWVQTLKLYLTTN